MIRNLHNPNAPTVVAIALADEPQSGRHQSLLMVRELTALGLTEETSLGILRVLMRCGTRPAGVDSADH